MKKNLSPLVVLLLILCFSVLGVSAYVHEQTTQHNSQTVIEVANINIDDLSLGDINEGETKTYTRSTVPTLGDAIRITTTTANIYLHLNSNLDTQSSAYEIYTITLKYATVPESSNATSGDTAATLTPELPDPLAISLDASGTWTFDFEIKTKPNPVLSNTGKTVSIIVAAESTT
jgi:hypothetical protein